MMGDFRAGQNVELANTDNPTNLPYIGQQGTVIEYQPTAQTATVRWVNGEVTEVRLSGAEGVDELTTPTTIDEEEWRRVLASVTARAASDGLKAAEAWSRDHADDTPEQLDTIARRILAAIDDDTDLDASLAPQYTMSGFAQPPTIDQLSQMLTTTDHTVRVPVTWWQQADWEYRDAFEGAVQGFAEKWASRVVGP